MPIDFTAHYFDLFSLPVSFDIDAQQLAERYRRLLSEVHPDRFASANAQSRRLSVQASAQINQAYETLRDPLKRGFYLLELAGMDVAPGSETTADAEFLMEQMELRERLEALAGEDDPLAAADALREELTAARDALFDRFRAHYTAGELAAARDDLTRLQFYERMAARLDDIEARLEDELL